MNDIASIKEKRSWNKTDLTFLLANQANISKVKAANYINILAGTIAEALESGKKVTISDFGTFQVSERRSFAGRNPKTGESIRVPVRRIPVFRAGKRLKSSLNTPQLKECLLVDIQKVKVKFSKLMDNKDPLLTDPNSYDVAVDGNSVGPITNVEVSDAETQGVRSVILTCTNKLRGASLQVLFKKGISDLHGNAIAVD